MEATMIKVPKAAAVKTESTNMAAIMSPIQVPFEVHSKTKLLTEEDDDS